MQFDDEIKGPEGVEGYWLRLDHETLHVHFFGTDHKGDVLADLAIKKTVLAYQSITLKGIHYGFAQYARRGLAIVEALLADQGCKKLYVTGHSLGGAIAQLVGIVLTKMGYTVEVEVCGAPRVGGFWLWFRTRKMNIRRIEIMGDPVARLPPFIFGYIHTGARTEYLWMGDDSLQSLYDRHQPAAYQRYVKFNL